MIKYKLPPKNYRPNFCKKVATNLTAQNCFKSSLRFCENFVRAWRVGVSLSTHYASKY